MNDRDDELSSAEAIDNLKYFVAEFFDGSIGRCFDLDRLLWQVRWAKSREMPQPEMRSVVASKVEEVINLDDLNLEELGL